MYLGAASMIGTTGAGYSGNIPHEFDVLTYTNEDLKEVADIGYTVHNIVCLLYTSPSPRDVEESRMPSSA